MKGTVTLPNYTRYFNCYYKIIKKSFVYNIIEKKKILLLITFISFNARISITIIDKLIQFRCEMIKMTATTFIRSTFIRFITPITGNDNIYSFT